MDLQPKSHTNSEPTGETNSQYDRILQLKNALNEQCTKMFGVNVRWVDALQQRRKCTSESDAQFDMALAELNEALAVINELTVEIRLAESDSVEQLAA